MTLDILDDGCESIAKAADIIRRGGLVAFATETVYGVGADATNDDAVAAIFQAKGRPRFNPLILHFADAADMACYVEFDARAEQLARAFWPGALTLVLPRKDGCPASLLASAGLDTLAVRVPGHPLARNLIRAAGIPLAAPSANRSGEVSPSTAAHVADGLGERIDAVIDGGPCAVGLESTVIDLATPAATLLRPGGIPREDIEAVIGPVALSEGNDDDTPRSPGMLSRHYAPSRPLRLNAERAREGEALLAFGPAAEATLNLSPTGDLKEAAANLFAMLRKLDAQEFEAIAVMPIPESGLGTAINDRLRRAATP